MPVFEVGLDKERKIYGIGEFGLSSCLLRPTLAQQPVRFKTGWSPCPARLFEH